jgi:hypothetical protein
VAARERIKKIASGAYVPVSLLAHWQHMPADLRYRGRLVTAEDIVFIRQFIAENASLSRRKLSAKLCEAWDWKQANGALCDMVCRGLLLMLHRAGEIELPATRLRPSCLLRRNLHRSRPFSRDLLSRGKLETAGAYYRARQGLHQQTPQPFH